SPFPDEQRGPAEDPPARARSSGVWPPPAGSPSRRREPRSTMRIPRATILERLRRLVEEGKPLIGAGAGTGISAKCAEAGGVDLIIIYNSGRYRMAGRGSLAGMLPY